MIVFIYIAFLQYYKNYNKENMGKPPQKQTKTILNLSTVSDIPKIIGFGTSDCFMWKMFMIELVIKCKKVFSIGQKKIHANDCIFFSTAS